MSDKSIVDQIKHYQRDIIKSPENAKRMIRCIERLMVLPVTIAHLQETGVGRSVNELRKCGGEVGAAANALVCKWKSMVQAEEDSDVESEVEEHEPKETLQVSSPDILNSPSTKNVSLNKEIIDSVSKHKKTQENEEHRKQKSDHSSKKSESSHSENKYKSLDKEDHKVHKSKSSKSGHNPASDSKHSSSHRSKADHDSKSRNHSSHRVESGCNGYIKTERQSSKKKDDEHESRKSSSSESKNKDIKQKNYNDKYRSEVDSHRDKKDSQRKEKSSHRSSSSSKKYDARRIESESSDDDSVYKPRSKMRKKSESEEERKPGKRSEIKSSSEEEEEETKKYNRQNKHRDHIKRESSDDSDMRNGSEGDENSQASSRSSEVQNESENEEDISNKSSPNNMSDNEAESDSRRSSPQDHEYEGSQSDKDSDSGDNDDSSEKETYDPTKIKREKESPPSHSRSSSDKSKSSHSRSNHNASNHHSSSRNSRSHSRYDKVSSNKKEGSGEMKIKKENHENGDSKKRRGESCGDKKRHKTSTDSPAKGDKSEKKVKIKIEKEDDGSIDCVSGASFADALMGLSKPKKKSNKRKSSPEKPSKSAARPVETKSKSPLKTEARSSSSSSSSNKTGFKEPDLLSKNIKLEPLDVDLKSTLPEISPHYKPLPHYSPPGSPPGKRTKLLSQEEALSTIMSTKNQRTKVYSGNKSGYLKVPSLFDLCIQVLRDNIEALEYTGGVPYDLLKPVLDRATAAQLFQLEHYNPYLVEDTDGLWKFHCNKDFRGKEPDEFESWRELYVRLLDERERKLEALKANITQSMAKNTPVRQTKLAYVDSVVKPPRNIAKKQMKFGTSKAVKHDLVSKAMVGAASSSPAPPAVPVPAPPTSSRSSQSNAFPIPGFLKKKKAPLMQKTLQLIKGNRFKR